MQLHDIIYEGQNDRSRRSEKERLSDDIRGHQSLNNTLIEQSGISTDSQEKNTEKVAYQQLVSGDTEGHISTNIDVVSSPTLIHLAHVKRYQWWVFFRTFGAYFMAHFSRKCYSTVKQQLQDDAGYSAHILSGMDSAFIGTYAIGNIFSGKLGDTFRPTTALSIGLCGNAICLFLVNMSLWFDFVGFSMALGNFFIILVNFLFGFFQGIGDAVAAALMRSWFCDRESVKKCGLIFGIWNCHQYFGDITAQLTTAYVLKAGYKYWWALLIPSIANFLWGCLVMRLVSDPTEIGITTNTEAEATVDESCPAPIAYTRAILIPMVSKYTLAFGFFKLTDYVLFFWLPYFLGKHFDPVTANLIPAVYSVGMMPAGIIVGIVSKLFGGRYATVVGVFASLLLVFLGIFFQHSETLSLVDHLVILAIMGIIVGGLNDIFTNVLATGLASHPSVNGYSRSFETLTRLINVCGGIIASIGLLAVGPLQYFYGWSSVWFFLMGCTGTGTLLMSTEMYTELFPTVEVDTVDGLMQELI
ncbi:hypothetical protein CTEN210_09066 [Chaetoceros tenuissimus]|uniref:Major facilitator superfamily (MFS) profile domain-containing protein n=1 Tax=Chaetoceros tenuissimus TaxID=426638 RepID=A0AAD3CX41_9STRA|nr:hypothetical protein CTEN210_09066 [Chaetoceros tenuissimus]